MGEEGIRDQDFEKVNELRTEGDQYRRGDPDKGVEKNLNEAERKYRAALQILNDEAVGATAAEFERMKAEGRPKHDLTEEAKRLSEIYGVRGGLSRRLALIAGERRKEDQRIGFLSQALDEYKSGKTWEQHPEYGHANSYNLVNVIGLSIMLSPESFPSLQDDLKNAVKVIKVQTRDEGRSGSYWAYADLGRCHALLGNKGPALMNYDKYHSKGGVTEAKAFDSTLSDLCSLRESLQGVDDRIVATLDGVLDELQKR